MPPKTIPPLPKANSPSLNSPRNSKQKSTIAMDKAWMDDKFRTQSEFIVSLLSKKLDESEKKITEEIGRELKEIKDSIIVINNRVTQLESSQTEAKTDIAVLNTEVKNIKISLSDLSSNCTRTESLLITQTSDLSNVNTQLDNNTQELRKLKLSLSTFENRIVAKDAFLFGIPYIPKENLKSIFNLICTTVNIKPPTLNNIHRTRPKINTNENTAIMIKFNSAYDKNFVLTSIANYRKTNNKQL